jgi:hypothetical protein
MRVLMFAMTALLCVSCAPQDRQASALSSDDSSASALPNPSAQSQEDVDSGGGSTSGASQEQAQTDGPALSYRKDSTICIENLSSITPVVTFTSYKEQVGEGSLKYRARACATGSKDGVVDVRGRIEVPAPYASLDFTADSPSLPFYKPYGALWQERDKQGEPPARCIGPDGYSVGDRRIWDDGLLQYVIERQPNGVGNVFLLTIRASAKPSADGTPAKCPK